MNGLLTETIISTERRHFTRVSFVTAGELICVDAHLEAQVLDLSLKGALLQLPEGSKLQSGSPCLLKLTLGEGGPQIAMAGEIAHVEGHRVGMLCRSIDLESITHLRRLIVMNTGDPMLLQRDLQALAG
ncbi:PilZ domain-containing protein [Burkholderiaceae bacterium UC74_6]